MCTLSIHIYLELLYSYYWFRCLLCFRFICVIFFALFTLQIYKYIISIGKYSVIECTVSVVVSIVFFKYRTVVL